MKPKTHYALGLGANLGARVGTFRAAKLLLDADPESRVIKHSRIYDTAPVGPPQGRYLNAALTLESQRDPHALLTLTQSVETQLGRTRDPTQPRWGPRNLDIDILTADLSVISDSLTIPHPELSQRPFALAPLFDVAPEAATAAGYDPTRTPAVIPDELEVPAITADVKAEGSLTPACAGVGPSPLDAFVTAASAWVTSVAPLALEIVPAHSLEDAAEALVGRLSDGFRFRCFSISEAATQGEAPLQLRLFGAQLGPERHPPLRLQQQHGRQEGERKAPTSRFWSKLLLNA